MNQGWLLTLRKTTAESHRMPHSVCDAKINRANDKSNRSPPPFSGVAPLFVATVGRLLEAVDAVASSANDALRTAKV